MQETRTRVSEDEDPSAPRPQWVRIVAIAVALAMLAGFVIAAVQSVTGTEVEPTPDGGLGGASEPDFSLTDEQALQTFDRLVTHSYRAIEQRDKTMLFAVFTEASPTKDRAEKVISSLREDRVFDESTYESVSTEVLINKPQEIRVSQRVLTRPCFRSEGGEDVTTGSAAIEYDIEWTMRLGESRWLLYESEASNDEVVDDSKATC